MFWFLLCDVFVSLLRHILLCRGEMCVLCHVPSLVLLWCWWCVVFVLFLCFLLGWKRIGGGMHLGGGEGWGVF